MPIQSHDEHFAAQPADVRRRLEQIHRAVESRVPGATSTARHNMPAFQLERTLFYFAAFGRHIGIYPPVTHDQALIRDTAALRRPKGNLSIPHTEELPLALIKPIAAALATEYDLR